MTTVEHSADCVPASETTATASRVVRSHTFPRHLGKFVVKELLINSEMDFRNAYYL